MPILTEEEKRIQRKNTYDKIFEEVKNNPPIDPKKLLKKVNELVKLLDYENF